MTGDERIALLLAARLLECGVTLESPELGGEGGHVNVALNLTDRLRRVAHRIVWVNPLKASPGYEPLARGMAAALPFVDEFVEGHSLDSLEELARIIASDDRGTRASR